MRGMVVLFTFFTVIYLMNLFVGLLNIAINDYNKYEAFLLQKAKVFFLAILYVKFILKFHNLTNINNLLTGKNF